jgi:spore coat protein U-like protein
MIMTLRLSVCAAVAVLLSAGAASAAGTTTGNLNLQAIVPSSCSATTSSLDFGNIDPGVGTVLPVLANINVTCALGTSFSVGLGDGANYSSGRRLSSGGGFLSYELYKDLLATSRFGDAVASERLTGQIGLGVSANVVPVYGVIAGGQNVSSGTYTDTVLVTVYY